MLAEVQWGRQEGTAFEERGPAMKRAVAVCVLVLLAAGLAGCRSGPTMRDVDPNVVVLEKVETLTQDPLPKWALAANQYDEKKADCEYFVGIGFPRQTLVFAMESASLTAYQNIARYIGSVVATKMARAGEAKNVHGQQSLETIIEELVTKSIALARVKGAKHLDTHVERVSAHHRGTQVLLYRIYQLYEVPRKALVQSAKTTAANVAQEIQNERDEIRKEQLEKLKGILNGLSADDFAL
jgi:hypothetical protein